MKRPIDSKSRAKVAGRFFNPIGMTKYLNSPMLHRVKAVYDLRDFGEMGIFQKPFVISMTLKKVLNCPSFEKRRLQ
jgi:hypothetical protein